LSEVVGQEHITDTLARAIKAGRISHAYLFTGPRGTGKTSVARILAHEINGLPYSDVQNLDIVEIDAASNRRIDDIRDLREKVHIAPISTKYKVYIIDEVHMLTGESFNALLKTLEEPPSHVVFILATTEVHKLPATIISRTQRYAFKPGGQEAMVNHLKMIAAKESITIDDEALGLVAEHGEGSFRDSLSLLDQLIHITAGPISAQDVADALGLAPKKQITLLVDALTAGDTATIMATISVLEQQGGHIAALVDQLNKALLEESKTNSRFLLLIDQLLDVPRAYRPQLKLTTVLAKFASDSPRITPKSAATMVAPPLTIASLPPKPITPEGPPAEPSPEPTPPPASPIEALEFINPADWSRVLDAMKRKSPPIYSVLKQAQPSIADGILLLTFKFNLHSKKLDDAKQKALVASVIKEAVGVMPQIKVVVDPSLSASPIQVSIPSPVADVTEIMGGGEIINGATI
ncbi:MAG TPA: DNA polymerase III subunit gamma/tau, partial [Magnetospirillaceae bacterium]|nr:DNA polymerase III subunit gamma/tau [Magnetospirillaceae bacterium]